MSYVTDDDNIKIQAVIDAGAVPPLIELLKSNETSILTPALRTVGNIVTGNDVQVSIIIFINFNFSYIIIYLFLIRQMLFYRIMV